MQQLIESMRSLVGESQVIDADPSRGEFYGRLIEFDPATDTIHWDLAVNEEQGQANPGGYKVPRSVRTRSWWPGGAP